jgi:hypothetical protein
VEVYVLRLNRRRLVFHAEPAPPAPDAESKPGWRGRAERLWARWQEKLRAAEGGAGGLLRRVEAFLRRFESPDEPMLRALRTATEVVLVHPTDVDPERVRHSWTSELRRQVGNQLLWLVVNSIVGPVLAVGLAILPGPNVIGYWFLYRAGAHAMAWTGVRRALRGQIPTTLRAEPLLDAPLRSRRRVDPAVLARLESHCGLATLRGMLDRKGWLRGGAGEAESASEPSDTERS